MKSSAEMSRDELVAEIMNELQICRFAVEAILNAPDKAALNQSRASMIDKNLRRVQEGVKKLGS